MIFDVEVLKHGVDLFENVHVENDERPRYMPRWFNVRAIPPEALIGWFVLLTPLCGWVVVSGFIDGSLLSVVSAVAFLVFFVGSAAVYVPRAWRAHKAGERECDLRTNWPWRR